MSERPDNSLPIEPAEPGGWHAYKEPDLWKMMVTPEEEPTSGWTEINARPDDLNEEPEKPGEWHVPKPEDTSFTPDDVITDEPIQAPTPVGADAPMRPEDLIAQIIGQQKADSIVQPQDALRPEDAILNIAQSSDTTEAETEAVDPLRPEDSLNFLTQNNTDAETELADPMSATDVLTSDFDPSTLADAIDDDDDDDAFSMSEFTALADLASNAGQDDSNTIDLAGQLQTDDLTPAQKALLANEAQDIQPATDLGGESASDYAARMAAQFGGDGGTGGAPPSMDDDSDSNFGTSSTGGESASDYAARMAAQFGGATSPQTPASSTQPLSPADQELAEKFRETKRQVDVLRAQYNNNQITYDQLYEQLRSYTLLDNQNQWWMLGVETDQWYRFDSTVNDWVADTPPVPVTTQSPPTETGALDPNQVIAGSLPILPQSGSPQEYSDPYGTVGMNDATYGTQFDPTGQGDTPVPNMNQPQVDPNLTQPGNAYNADYLGEPTVQNMNAVGDFNSDYGNDLGATMQSQSQGGDFAANYGNDYGNDAYGVPAGQNSLIESAVDTSIPPDYTLDENKGDLYGELQTQQSRSSMRIVIFALVGLVACGLVTAITGVGGAVLWYNQQVEPYAAQIASLTDFTREFQTARILDADGELIAELLSPDGGARDEVTLDEISPFMVHAVLSVENRTFYDDPGFDIVRIIGAFLGNLGAGEVESGASTITQQLARNLVLQDTNVSAERKIREILVAMEISRTYSKNQILELYMNEVFFGNQSYGVEAAAQFYFDKPASELNMAESALLTGLIQSPAANDPVVNREQSKIAMRNSIRLMLEADCLQFQFGQWEQSGQPFCINETSQVDFNGSPARLVVVNNDGTYGGLLSVQLAQVETRNYQPREFDYDYPHFVNYVLGQLEQTYGSDAIFQRGFTVYTTLIPRIQEEAESGLRTRVDTLVNNGVNTGAVMVTDPTTGAIRAMVGSPDFTDDSIDGQVDNTRTFQQPGSSIKPILYTAAVEGGANGYLTPASILWDVPTDFGGYQPTNFSNRFYGPVSMRTALQNSYNVSAVKTLETIGIDKYIDVTSRMQINFTDGSEFNLTSALGSNEVRLIDMMKAYGIIANDGLYVPLYTIDRITEVVDGQTLEVALEARPEPTRAISEQTAFIMQNILSDDPTRASAFGLNSPLTLVNAGVPSQNYVGAKTGTSSGANDFSGNPADLWTMGFTNNTVTGVWLGTWDNSPIIGATGFTASSPLWNQVMTTAITGRAPAPFQNPGGVVQNTICRETGTLASDDCPTRVTEIYIQQQPPPAADSGFVKNINVDSWTGLLANEWCPENVVSRTVADIGDASAVNWLNNTTEGQQYSNLIGLPLPLQAAPASACVQGQQLPSIRLINPASGQTLTGQVAITGQVSAPDFNRYDLEFASANNPEFFQSISTSTQQLASAGSQLGTWDTTLLPNGDYIVRLAAYSNTGGNIIRTATIRIENTLPTPTPTVPAPVVPTLIPATPNAVIPNDSQGGGAVSTPIPFDGLNPTPTATLAF